MAKKIDGYIKLMIPAGAANPSPPLGPALGQRGVNIMEFAKAFNAKTGEMEKNIPVPTEKADLSANDIEAGALIIAGSARSMGYEVTG